MSPSPSFRATSHPATSDLATSDLATSHPATSHRAISSQGISSQVHDARILVAITVHYNPSRLEYLAEVMRSLGEFPVAAMDIVLVTNTMEDDDLAVLGRLGDEILPGGRVAIRSYEHLAHPHYLTWRHKELVRSEFAEGNDGRYTYFIYLEDDIRLSFANFSYFVEYREILRDAGLLPSFVRVEYNRALHGFVNSDNKVPVDVSRQPSTDAGEVVLANVPFPYCACYILDAPLAAEFLRTRSFKRERSRAVSDWEVRERAAMGLCFENVPEQFQCRYVVPISKATGMALNRAWISHLPNNYANDPTSDFGKLRMDRMFENAAEPMTPGGTNGTGRQVPRKRWSDIDLYMVLPNKVIEGIRWRLGLRR